MNFKLMICVLTLTSFVNLNAEEKPIIKNSQVDSSSNVAVDMVTDSYRKYNSGEISKEQFMIDCISAAKLSDNSSKVKASAVQAQVEKETVTQKNTFLESAEGKAAVDYESGYNQWAIKNKNLIARMSDDYKSYFRNTKPGVVGKIPNGTLYRLDNQRALFVGLDGSAILQEEWNNSATAFNDWASRNEFLAKEWKAVYGYIPYGDSRSASSIEIDQQLKKHLNDPMVATTSAGMPSWLVEKIRWSAEQYNTLKRGESRQWNGYTILRAGSQNVLYVISSQGEMAEVYGRVEYNSSVLDPNSFFSRFGKQFWGLKI